MKGFYLREKTKNWRYYEEKRRVKFNRDMGQIRRLSFYEYDKRLGQLMGMGIKRCNRRLKINQRRQRQVERQRGHRSYLLKIKGRYCAIWLPHPELIAKAMMDSYVAGLA